MGHDVSCAICGGPAVGVDITKYHPEAVKVGEEPGIDLGGHKPFQSPAYNHEIITNEDAEWTATVMLLGFNPSTKRIKNGAFLVTSGTTGDHYAYPHYSFDDDSDICHLNEDSDVDNYFQCYNDFASDGGYYAPAFPFHAPCYDVFQRRLGDRIAQLAPASSLAAVDKNVLYSVMHALTDFRSLKINYGSPDPHLEDWQFWDSKPGEEIFAANPGLVEGLESRIRGMMAEGYFALSHHAELDLSHGVRQDPFQELPYDILLNITGHFEEPTSFLKWAKASWFAHAFLRSAQDSFWERAIRMQMGWFIELLLCLDDSVFCDAVSMRAIFLWAACGAEPRLGMKGGHFLRIANRQRIWNAPCAELANKYCRKLSPDQFVAGCEDSVLDFQDILFSKALCSQMYVVTHNKQARLYNEAQKCFWVDEWEETYTKTQVIEAFFMRSNGFLTGIALTTEGGECRLLGSIEEMPLRFDAIISTEDWICGMVLHIPAVQFVGTLVDDVGETSPKGITIICKSGREIYLGETDRGHPVRALVARPGCQIVGLVSQMAVDTPLPTFTRLGLITLDNESLGDRRILHDHMIRQRHPRIDEVMWKDDGTTLLGTPYWNNPSIRILSRKRLGVIEDDKQTEVHQQLLSYEALIWARDATELRQLKKLSIFTTYSQIENNDSELDDTFKICGIGVDFSAEHIEGRRVIGLEGKIQVDGRDGDLPINGPILQRGSDAKLGKQEGDGDFCVELDIDGPGGEIISELVVDYSQEEPVNCLKFRTNRGRETGCTLGPDDPAWLSIKAPPNTSMVGIIATFAHGYGGCEGQGLRTYKELTAIAALTMPLGIDEETGEESNDEDYDEDEGIHEGVYEGESQEEDNEEDEGDDDEMSDQD